jgi:hypothetical protein
MYVHILRSTPDLKYSWKALIIRRKRNVPNIRINPKISSCVKYSLSRKTFLFNLVKEQYNNKLKIGGL